jgi:predicted transcriptional regulator of viral defense system
MAVRVMSDRPRTAQAADWALSRGIAAMTTAEVAGLLGVPASQVPQRMAAPKARGEWVTPTRGLWVPVAPEFRAWGGPPATEFIASLMAHLDVAYYVGWLAAASPRGAAHQAPQVTHVATSGMVRARQIGQARLVCHQRDRVGRLPTVERLGRSGAYQVSSPEATALDVALDIAISGGLDNAATVIADLARDTGLDDRTLAGLAHLYPAATPRRVGWVVERFTDHRLDTLAAQIGALAWAPSRLHPSLPLTGSVDQRWALRLNTTVDVE